LKPSPYGTLVAVTFEGQSVRRESLEEPKPGFRTILANRSVGTVIFAAFVMMTGFGVTAPTMPLYARSFGVGYGAAGLLISVFGLSRLVFDLVAGPLVDRFGERRCAGFGLLFQALCALLTGLAPTFPLALAFWAAGGAGSAIAFASLYSYLLRVVPQQQMARTLGIFYGSFNAGIIAGGPIGGFLGERLGLASPLFAYAVLVVIASAVFWRLVPEPTSRGDDSSSPTEPAGDDGAQAWLRRVGAPLMELLRLTSFKTVILLNFAYLWLVATVYDTLVPLFGKDGLGMSTAAIGGVFAIAVATEFLVLYPAGSLADRIGRKPVLVPSLAALAVVVVALGFSSSALIFGLLMALVGVTGGFAGVPPAAMLSDLVPPERSGTGIGLFRFCGDLGFFLGPLVAGASTNALGFKGAFALAAVPIVAAVLLVLRTPETLGREKGGYKKKNDTAIIK
jgi:MFS transporter, DHA1 family, multidrug resistance protein